jgi:hypothetical protein
VVAAGCGREGVGEIERERERGGRFGILAPTI